MQHKVSNSEDYKKNTPLRELRRKMRETDRETYGLKKAEVQT